MPKPHFSHELVLRKLLLCLVVVLFTFPVDKFHSPPFPISFSFTPLVKVGLGLVLLNLVATLGLRNKLLSHSWLSVFETCISVS